MINRLTGGVSTASDLYSGFRWPYARVPALVSSLLRPIWPSVGRPAPSSLASSARPVVTTPSPLRLPKMATVKLPADRCASWASTMLPFSLGWRLLARGLSVRRVACQSACKLPAPLMFLVSCFLFLDVTT
jgi:hypothetical protein